MNFVSFQYVTVGATPLRLNGLYVQMYVVWMKLLIIELIPYVTIMVLNAIMIIK